MDARTIDEFAYRIDAQDRIVAVDRAWLDFARDNDLPQLDRNAAVGHPLLDFISDAETRHLYELVFTRARETNRRIVLPFRCDSPSIRRYMELVISPEPDRALALVGRLLHVEARERVDLLDARLPRSTSFLLICGWCKRAQVGGRWLEVEEAVSTLRLFDNSRLPQLTHGICPDCRRAVILALE